MTYTDKEIEAAANELFGLDLLEEDRMERARDVLSAVPREPEGWRLVPVNPNDALLKKMSEMFRLAWWGADNNSRRDAYRAILSAAPRYGEGK